MTFITTPTVIYWFGIMTIPSYGITTDTTFDFVFLVHIFIGYMLMKTI